MNKFLLLLFLLIGTGTTLCTNEKRSAQIGSSDNWSTATEIYNQENIFFLYGSTKNFPAGFSGASFTQEETEIIKNECSENNPKNILKNLEAETLSKLQKALNTSSYVHLLFNAQKVDESYFSIRTEKQYDGSTNVIIWGKTDKIPKFVLHLLIAIIAPPKKQAPKLVYVAGGTALAATALAVGLRKNNEQKNMDEKFLDEYFFDTSSTNPTDPHDDPKKLIDKCNPDFFVQYFRNYFDPSSIKPRDPHTPLKDLIGEYCGDGMMKGGLSNKEAEEKHDWIQYAFPTNNQSSYCHWAPTSTPDTNKYFEASPQHKQTLLKCFLFYLNFMGVKLIKTKKRSDSSHTFVIFDEQQLQSYFLNTHNFKRTTRIIYSLRLHGLDEYAHLFFDFLTTLSPRVPKATKTEWDDESFPRFRRAINETIDN